MAGPRDRNLDVPAVQAEVDHGVRVVLTGHFPFDRRPAALAVTTFQRMVTVKAPEPAIPVHLTHLGRSSEVVLP